MSDADPRFQSDEAEVTVKIVGPMSAEGFLDVSGAIGSRLHLLRAIDALVAAADRLWPKAQRRVVVPMPGDKPLSGGGA